MRFVVLVLMMAVSSAVAAQEEGEPPSRIIKRQGEEFVVRVLKDEKKATVTDKTDVVVTITPSAGNFNVRLPNGWGSWVPTMEAAVNRAISLSFKFRSQVTADEALQEMIEYVKKKDEDEPEKP